MLKKKLNNKLKGFSLIEILIVCSLFVIIAAFTFPSFSFFERQILKSDVEKVFVIINYLQQKSLASNKNQKLFIDADNNRYGYENCNQKTSFHSLNPKISFGFLNQSKGPPSSPQNFIKNKTTFPKENNFYVINFEPNGQITPGTIYFINKKHNCMAAISTPISQISFVRMYRLKGNRWILKDNNNS